MLENIKLTFKNYSPYINGSENCKIAAVTIPLININGGTEVLFEIRSNSLRTNPNEICFPGGKLEMNEPPLSAAIRETCEELGITSNDIYLISPLDVFVSPFNIIIHPYLIEILNYNNICINQSEVNNIFTVPLDHFTKVEPQLYRNQLLISPNENFPYDLVPNKSNYNFSKGNYDIVFYKYNDYIIWGITAKILYNFICQLKLKNFN